MENWRLRRGHGHNWKKVYVIEKGKSVLEHTLTSLLDHFIGKTTLRKCGPFGVLLVDEEVAIVEWVLGMQECDLSISLHHLKLKVLKLTQTCVTPFKYGIPRTSWWRWFKQRHLEISIRLVEGLDIFKAQGLTPTIYSYFYENLQSLYNKHNYLPNHIWNCDEIGIKVGRQYGAWMFVKKDHNKSTTQYQSQGNGW